VNVRGQLVPVVDVRRRLALPAKVLDPDEFLVVFATGERTFALRVDDVDDLVDVDPATVVAPAELSGSLRGLAGLAARDDGLLVMHDPDAFVTQAEAHALDAALAARA
jgi:purine-binding chemotaxis protein CheW